MSTSGNPNEGDLPHWSPPMREILRRRNSQHFQDSKQGFHTPFWDWGPGPRALGIGKIAVFSLILGKKTTCRHILLSIYVFPLIVHHISYKLFCFDRRLISCIIILEFIIFFSTIPIFFLRSQIGKIWGLNWEKKILF